MTLGIRFSFDAGNQVLVNWQAAGCTTIDERQAHPFPLRLRRATTKPHRQVRTKRFLLRERQPVGRSFDFSERVHTTESSMAG